MIGTERTVGIYLPLLHRTGRHKYLGELNRQLSDKGYKVMCFQSYSDLYADDKFNKGEMSVYTLSLSHRFAALVVYSELIKDENLIRTLVAYGSVLKIPVFCIDREMSGAYNIKYGYKKTFEEIVSHIIEEHGARNIYMISGIEGNSFSIDRNDAYRHALESHGIEFDESKIYYGDFWENPAKEATAKLLDKCGENLPDAIVCANDIMARAVCLELEERDIRIPQDVIVTGFDGIDRSIYGFPSITTAEPDYFSAAEYIVNEIISCQQGKKPEPCTMEFGFRILPMQSCGCKPMSYKYAGRINYTLYEQMGRSQLFRSNMDHMVLQNNDGRDIVTAINSSTEYIKTVLYRGLEIYLDPNYFGSPKGLTCSKVMAAKVEPNSTDISVPFTEADEKALCSDELFENSDCLMFVPIHRSDSVYGYCVTQFRLDDQEGGERLYDFITSLNILFSGIDTTATLEETVHELDKMHVHDSLTELLNRRGFNREIYSLIIKACSEGKNIAIISADMDGLKYINDNYGHAEGDFAIEASANLLRDVIGDKGICARFGGDEFMAAVICDDPPVEYERVINDELVKLNSRINKDYPIHLSVGIEVTAPENSSEHIEELIKKADAKMYKKKRLSKLSRSFKFPTS